MSFKNFQLITLDKQKYKIQLKNLTKQANLNNFTAFLLNLTSVKKMRKKKKLYFQIILYFLFARNVNYISFEVIMDQGDKNMQ